MALSFDRAAETLLRHVVARSRGRRVLYADAAARAGASRRLAGLCERYGLHCLVWSVTDRCLHFVIRGRAGASALAVRRDRRHGTALRPLPVDGRQCRPVPAGSGAPCAARAGARRPGAARDRLAALERARILRPLPRSALARSDAALRIARFEGRTGSIRFRRFIETVASRPQRSPRSAPARSRRGSRPRTSACRQARAPACPLKRPSM